TRHMHASALFVRDSHLSTLAQFMLESAEQHDANNELVRSYLATFLLSVDRSWKTGRVIESNDRAHFGSPPINSLHAASTDDAQSAILQRARDYIQSHLVDAVSPSQIARHSCTSESQLKRVFRARLNTTVMQYVAKCRLDE